MVLSDVLKMINCNEDDYKPTINNDGFHLDLDCRPVINRYVMICFMCEEETWEKYNISSPILIPWYDCTVSSLEPVDDRTIGVWLSEEKYILDHWKDKVRYIHE